MKILLVGCGNVGSALVGAWADSLPGQVLVVQPSLSYSGKGRQSAEFFSSISEIPAEFEPDVSVLCVKPQDLSEILPQLRGRVFVSFLAGVQIQSLGFQKIARIMPNLGLRHGESVNLAFQVGLDLKEVEQVEQLLYGTGTMFWLKSESLLDALTPISGSGPAYFMLLADLMSEEMVKLGLSNAIAREITGLVMSTAASMSSEGKDYKSLINSVSSKGGVTEAAVATMRPSMEKVVKSSLSCAMERIKEISGEDSS